METEDEHVYDAIDAKIDELIEESEGRNKNWLRDVVTSLVRCAVLQEREECAAILERNDTLYTGSPEAGYRREQRMADEIRGRT